MLTSVVLRVGICGCAPFYHGKFNGKVMTISCLAGRKLRKPIEFVFEEVPIPEENHAGPLLEGRCHFFLDVHQGSGTLFALLVTELSMYDKPYRAVWGSYLSLAAQQSYGSPMPNSLYKSWATVIEPASIEEIVATMQSFIGRLSTLTGRRRINKWALDMKLPEEAVAS